MYDTSNSTIIIHAKSGSIFLLVDSRLVFPTAQPTKRADPTGGVQRPMANVKMMMIPKWIAGSPMESATGLRIGVIIMISGAISMKHPRMSRIMIISRMSRNGFDVTPMIAAVIIAGIRRNVIM